MKKLLMVLLLMISSLVHAGQDGNGGDHLRDRFLLAKDFAERLFEHPVCHEFFGKAHCLKLVKKLKSHALPKWWTDEKNPLKCLVEGFKDPQPVIACTTEEETSPIEIDIPQAQKRPPTFLEAIILMGHEAGHVLKTSKSLLTDRILILMLNQTPGNGGKTLYQEMLETETELRFERKTLCQIVSRERNLTFAGEHNLYKGGTLIRNFRPTWNAETSWKSALDEAQKLCLRLQENKECRCRLTSKDAAEPNDQGDDL
jgi:hypothetical protein